MLVISSLTDTMAGYYYCSASYANSEMLENKVKVETYGEIDFFPDAFDVYVVCLIVIQLPSHGKTLRKTKARLLGTITLCGVL